MTDKQLEELRKAVIRLRRAIDRTKAEHPDQDDLPFISHWPSNCCDAPFLYILLYQLGHRGMIRKCADVSHFGKGFEKHVWVVADGITIDITADQFPGTKEAVIVRPHSAWHDNLQIINEGPWASDGDEDALYWRYLEASQFVYEDILPRYADFD